MWYIHFCIVRLPGRAHVKWSWLRAWIKILLFYYSYDNLIYYTFKVHSCFLLVDIHQLILNVRKPWHHFRRISWIVGWSCRKNIIGHWWRDHLKAAKITKQQKWPAAVWKVDRTSLFTANLFLHLSLFWIYNKTILDSVGLRQITLTSVWIILDIMLSLMQ